ncbi:DNA-primase RepB domain-containing protein [Quisquiliibacterium transsilvanicum]|uniref:RepB-like DNA primase domain-containing protein n=1 Tax=Quisquiliibacterium transsilvanicum TaxID=1549638 RepID=A0A7W8HGB1_9BURK|nr:DNA-primase RepB domain-containing protein [Quisquiliibacterium transsilvanicum]MBB5271312.1 hypothetical protein [Quisquiliibacterium transsilvanicum]
MEVDLLMAQRFLDALDPNGVFTFQTFDDSSAKRGNLAQVHHGRLNEHAERLVSLNRQGAGIFLMINRGDGIVRPGAKTCRTTANVTEIRSLFVDLDGSPIEPVVPHEPSIVVESSPSRWHAYWLVSGCPLNEFKLRQQQLAAKFGGDTKVCDLPRVMRLPGFFHRKGEPFMTRLIRPE